ncbi:MFS transporter [Xanthomonas axonopodis pv. vasculorum]|uniref:MFS transporter n=1 Tax=Xanthomonas axonopodis TaxID=53413 RepID=UPI000D46D431|nr:MFS transporter [Xanthomonas axonopodis]PPV10738.1 citrate-proton symporter [Xanthomonas axonopodis pv. vasculorum]QKD85761.1 MFS transporter [Xanthomonas axonopodis pv. vasculorum]
MHIYRGGRFMRNSPSEATQQSKLGMVLRVTSGNFLEQFDFFLFGFYATQIAAAFFPASNEFASLMMTFAVFGAGFLMRPLGAVILGAYIDDVGRRKGLIVTLAIMASGTVLIVLVPGYASIGLWAPALVLLGRLLQGFSAGAEMGGVSVYLAEMATPGRRGFYASWQSASQQLAIVAAAAIGFALNQLMAPQDLAQWGWRIPFGIGCVIIPFIFLLRRSLEETAEFAQRRQPVTMKQVMRGLANNAGIVIAGSLMVALTTTAFYLITVYAPTFGKSVLKLSTGDALIVTLLVGISNFIWLPIGGALSDRFGRKPLLLTMAVVCIVTAYPVLALLAAAPSFAHMLQALLWLSFIYGIYNGAMIPALTERMPAHVRVAGFSLAYSLATAVFGGFTPVISTWLIHVTGDKAAPGYWLVFASMCALGASLFLYRRQGNPVPASGMDAAAGATK